MLGGEAEAPLPPAPVREPSEHDGQRLCRSVGRCGGYAYIRPRGAGACAAAAAELSRVLSAAAAPPYQPLLLSSNPGQAEVVARLQLLFFREFLPFRCPALRRPWSRECASVATHGKAMLSLLSLRLLKKKKK